MGGSGLFGFIRGGADKRDKIDAAAENARKSQVVIDNISDGIAIIDSNGIIQLFNPAAEALTGWKESSAVQLDYRSIFNFVNNAGRKIESNENPIIKTFQTGTAQSTDALMLETISKQHMAISIKVTPVAGANNNIDSVVIVFRDITRERAEQNAQTDFISTASHEMRTPVAIIEGYLGMILNPETATIDNRARAYAEKAHESVKHLGRLFQDLLDVTKADDHRMENNPTLIDARKAAEQIVSIFKNRADSKGLRLQLEQPEKSKQGDMTVIAPPSIIYVDLDQLNEILSNLVENAIKYTKTGGISINVTNVDKRVRFEVADTGIGIPTEDIPHLFQKFYRIDNSETREIGGTGLGLYIIKKLTENMGGNVGVNSIYGQGSTFWVEFDALSHQEAIQRAREIQRRENTSKQ